MSYHEPVAATRPTCLTKRRTEKPMSRGQSKDRVQITAVSHLSEQGVDRRFIQVNVGHEADSSTAVHTHVSSDFMNTALRRALAPALGGDPIAGTER